MSANRKPKLAHARSLRGVYLIDPKDEEFKEIMKNTSEMFKNTMPAAMPCKTPINKGGRETCSNIGKTQDKHMLVLSKLTNP